MPLAGSSIWAVNVAVFSAPAARSARESHWLATTPRLKNAETPLPTSAVTVTGSLQSVACSASSTRASFAPTMGTAW